MYANPSSAQSIRYVREALTATIAPELQTDPAKVLLAMIDTILASVEKRIPVEQQYMADECGRMQALVRRAAGTGSGPGSAASAELAQLAAELPATPAAAPLPAFTAINDAYARTSDIFTRSLGAIHGLVAEGAPGAPALLDDARAYIALRLNRDMSTVFAMEGGMVGRG